MATDVIEDQIRECYGRVVYTHKTHEKMADRCALTLRRYKVAQILVAGLTATGVIGILVVDSFWAKLATAVLSLASFVISAYMKNMDPGGAAQKHRDAATDIWAVRESYLSLITDLRSGAIEDNAARARRDELQQQLAAIYKGAPQTDGKAYLAAQDALKNKEDMTFSEAEIDAFLPSPLRKAGH